jgi:DNA-binding transcriptional regulator YhcF (GntR family)
MTNTDNSAEQQAAEQEEQLDPIAKTNTAQARMLAYLGELLEDDAVPTMKMMADLDLIYNTCTMYLQELSRLGWVDIRKKATVNTVRLAKMPAHKLVAIVPEWDDAYGIHPYADASDTARRRAKYRK